MLPKAFGVRGQYEYERTGYALGVGQFYLRLKKAALLCPRGRRVDSVLRKGRRYRTLQTVPSGLKPVYLVSEVVRGPCHGGPLIFAVPPLCPSAGPLHASARKVR